GSDSGEGGCICASANRITASMVNTMVTHARGLVCLAMTDERMQKLGIPLLAADTVSTAHPVFGASFEASRGVSTGISAADRARTIGVAAAPDASAADIVMPGHVHPIKVSRGGVLKRLGLPEAAVDLVALAGDFPCAAICNILNDEGELAQAAEVSALASKLDLPIVDLADLLACRMTTEVLVRRVAERDVTSEYGGSYRAIVYKNDIDNHEHMAMIAGSLGDGERVTVRVHSQCLTGDVLGSARCDCGDQLNMALRTISEEGRGVLVYMHQEGRGIGLANKIRAYELQDCGRDTVEANLELGFKDDLRDYSVTAQILKDLGVASVALLTNNPLKVKGLVRYGVDIVERRPLQAPPGRHNIAYLRTKRKKLGHLLDSGGLDEDGGEGSAT
ncbi:MAG: GTP cyclohydrolase II, partial [Candidatus Binatia bacterium]